MGLAYHYSTDNHKDKAVCVLLSGATMRRTIKFISDRRYRWMSNFYGSPIVIDGTEYRTVEHAFQEAKTHDPEWKRIIRESRTPGDAKRMGRRAPMRDDWEDVKVEIMTELVRQKFRQNSDLAQKLLATGSRSIQEDSPWDDFWGTGKTGKGQNHMGKILKAVRRELQEKP